MATTRDDREAAARAFATSGDHYGSRHWVDTGRHESWGEGEHEADLTRVADAIAAAREAGWRAGVEEAREAVRKFASECPDRCLDGADYANEVVESLAARGPKGAE